MLRAYAPTSASHLNLLTESAPRSASGRLARMLRKSGAPERPLRYAFEDVVSIDAPQPGGRGRPTLPHTSPFSPVPHLPQPY
eukprot:1279076-Pleurochrysis_carterae.AAC.2